MVPFAKHKLDSVKYKEFTSHTKFAAIVDVNFTRN